VPTYVVKTGRRRKKRRKKLHSGVTPKQHADRTHSKNRAKNRYGIDLNREMRLAIKKAVESGQAVPSDCGYSTRTRDVYENVVPGHPDVPVVYSHHTKSPVTLRPKEHSCDKEKK